MDNRTTYLKNIPLFDSLNRQELADLADLFKEVAFKKAETVCKEGEAGDSLFIVLTGELEVWGGPPRERRVINRMGAGEFFGEITLLSGGNRTATVTVARDATMLALSRKIFETFFLTRPKMLEHLSKVIAQRLARVSRGEITPKASTIISVCGSGETKGKTLTAGILSELLTDFSGKKAIRVRLYKPNTQGRSRKQGLSLSQCRKGASEIIRSGISDRLDQSSEIEIGISDGREKEKARQGIGALIEVLSGTFSYIVMDFSTDLRGMSTAAQEISDFIISLDGSIPVNKYSKQKNGTSVFQIINHYNGFKAIPISHMEPFVLPVEPALKNLDSAAQSAYICRNVKQPIARPLHRLARKILGTTVGLALGGGAAFGIAHVGVIKVLEESGIPIDLVAGTSMGSIVAIGYAGGLSGAKMTELAKQAGTKWKTLSAADLTLFKPGFLRGNRLIKIFSPMLDGVETFDQLHLPCRTVAADIESGESVSIKSGRVDMAFRASCSVPMIWTPVVHQGRTLVDGGIVDPVPAEVVKEMGADICIAVNVVPPLKKGVENILSRLYRKTNQLNPLSYLSKTKNMPNMFDIIMNTIQSLEYELGNFKAIAADIRINPDLNGYTWIEFYKAAGLIKKGEEAAAQALPAIKHLISEKLSEGKVI